MESERHGRGGNEEQEETVVGSCLYNIPWKAYACMCVCVCMCACV